MTASHHFFKQTSWSRQLMDKLEANNDTLVKICIKFNNVYTFIPWDHYEFCHKFDNGFGAPEGQPFTAWGKRYVYFPAVYDGSEWIESVPRNPELTVTNHIGG